MCFDQGAFSDDAMDDCLEPIDALNVSLEKLPMALLNTLQAAKSSGNGMLRFIPCIPSLFL